MGQTVDLAEQPRIKRPMDGNTPFMSSPCIGFSFFMVFRGVNDRVMEKHTILVKFPDMGIPKPKGQ